MSSQSRKIEHLEDFTAHEWCNALLSDPSVTKISKRDIPETRPNVSNTFFIVTLFTDGAIRAYLSLFRPGKGRRREPGTDIFTGSIDGVHTDPAAHGVDDEHQRQLAKVEKVYSADDQDTPESLILVSVGNDIDGGTKRIHGGVTATLLDQVMGTLISEVFGHPSATADLNVKYTTAITTPCVLLARGKIVREKGRWIETKGWIEDGHGKIYAEGSGAFVLNKVVRPKM